MRNFCQRLSTGSNPFTTCGSQGWQNLHNACAMAVSESEDSPLQLARKYLARGIIRSGRTRRVGRFPATPTCPFVTSSPPSVSRSVESTRESISRGRVAAHSTKSDEKRVVPKNGELSIDHVPVLGFRPVDCTGLSVDPGADASSPRADAKKMSNHGHVNRRVALFQPRRGGPGEAGNFWRQFGTSDADGESGVR